MLRKPDNLTSYRHSLPYTLSRLKRERPDLFDRVAAKELSANAAAIAPVPDCRRRGHIALLGGGERGNVPMVLP